MIDNVVLILVRMRTWPKQQFFELRHIHFVA